MSVSETWLRSVRSQTHHHVAQANHLAVEIGWNVGLPPQTHRWRGRLIFSGRSQDQALERSMTATSDWDIATPAEDHLTLAIRNVAPGLYGAGACVSGHKSAATYSPPLIG